jgi:hypothetical protein
MFFLFQGSISVFPTRMRDKHFYGSGVLKTTRLNKDAIILIAYHRIAVKEFSTGIPKFKHAINLFNFNSNDFQRFWRANQSRCAVLSRQPPSLIVHSFESFY